MPQYKVNVRGLIEYSKCIVSNAFPKWYLLQRFSEEDKRKFTSFQKPWQVLAGTRFSVTSHTVKASLNMFSPYKGVL